MSTIVLFTILQIPAGILSNIVASYIQQSFDENSRFGQWATRKKLILFFIVFMSFQIPVSLLSLHFANEESERNTVFHDTFSGEREYVTVQTYSVGTAFNGSLIIEVHGIGVTLINANVSSPGYPGKSLSIQEGKIGGALLYEGAERYEIHILKIGKNKTTGYENVTFEVRLLE